MKILLTGDPGIGKSSILQLVRDNYNGEAYGIVAREVKGKSARVGFEAVDSAGNIKLFAHTELIGSKITVGNKYYVDINAIDTFVVPELEKGLNSPNSLVFIDEIGRMQSFSQLFLTTIEKLLNSNANILATIVLDPEKWSIPIKNHPDVVVVHVNIINRTNLPNTLVSIFQNVRYYNELQSDQKLFVINLLRKYLADNKYIQIKKLFKNAIRYLSEGRVKNISNTTYKVVGDHDDHSVEIINEAYSCDCNLYNGRSEYKQERGECSHIQSVQLFQMNEKSIKY